MPPLRISPFCRLSLCSRDISATVFYTLVLTSLTPRVLRDQAPQATWLSLPAHSTLMAIYVCACVATAIPVPPRSHEK